MRDAKRLNFVLGRRGAVWAERSHARVVTSPRATHNALVHCSRTGATTPWATSR